MKRMILVCGLALAVTVGCGTDEAGDDGTPEAPAAPSWLSVAESELVASERDQLQQAVTAQQEMASTLMGELKSELETVGPDGAVVVCRDMAPMIAAHVSEENGVLIGRTSHRLRNSQNLPPSWAEAVVGNAVGGSHYFRGPAGELGVLLPIKVAAPCLACHGPVDAIDPSVVAALDESYPEDAAVGFAEGDLRGWFWIEVPATAG